MLRGVENYVRNNPYGTDVQAQAQQQAAQQAAQQQQAAGTPGDESWSGHPSDDDKTINADYKVKDDKKKTDDKKE